MFQMGLERGQFTEDLKLPSGEDMVISKVIYIP
jgi:hypothetical protein